MAIADEFDKLALRVYEDGKKETGYNGTRYLQKVRKDGGVAAVKSWLRSAMNTARKPGCYSRSSHLSVGVD